MILLDSQGPRATSVRRRPSSSRRSGPWRWLYRLLAVLIAPLCIASVTPPPLLANEPRPNVIFILADDLGWSDVTLYGTTRFYQTPNIERLAARGMTFTRAYSASPLCSPTRASILTGLSPARHGITSPTCHLPQVVLQATPGTRAAADQYAIPVQSVTRLRTDYATLPKTLKAAGYATGHFGKWHLGAEPFSPLQHGFDVDLPHHPGPGPAGSYVAPWKFKDFDADPDQPQQHIEDRMAQEAVRWMEANQDRPFFLNYWMFSVHAPFDAKRQLIEKHRRRVDPSSPQRSPTYAAMIESMDDAVGTLLNAVDRLGLAERTLIVFASDNGGNMYSQVDGTVPTSNAPLRGGKATLYEGGTRGPCVVVWPGTVQPGSRSDEVIQSCDFYPSLLEMLGLPPLPAQTFDGISIVPALQGKSLKREAIFTYFPHNPRVPDWLPPAVSVQQEPWKLIRLFHGGPQGGHDWRLYNLQDDPSETTNLSQQHPDHVARLDRLIDQFLADTHAVQPTPNPDFDRASFRPEMIGKPGLRNRGNAQAKARTKRKPTPKPTVAGWAPSQHCELAVEQLSLRVSSSGGDPHLSFEFPQPLPAGDYTIEFSLRGKTAGPGQFFWAQQGIRPRFARDRSQLFELAHDQRTHAYQVDFKCSNPLTAVRLDPGNAAGQFQLTSVSLRGGDGQVVYRWKLN